MDLKPLENDFIEFISYRRGEPQERIKANYLAIRNSYKTWSQDFKKYREGIAKMNTAIWGYSKAADLHSHYKNLEGWWMIRFIGYSHNPEYMKLLALFPHSVTERLKRWPETIMDYGCGAGLWSYELARAGGNKPIVYLLDIPGISRDFAKWRLEKIGCRVDTIDVTDKQPNPWPIPIVDVCVVWSVLEHLLNPTEATKNIMSSIRPNGLIYAFLGAWKPEALHVNSRSEEIRKLILTKYKDMGSWFYKRNF